MKHSLGIRDLSYSYLRNSWSLGPLNVEFESGINLIVGPNAAGKSTILKLLAGLLNKKSGDISFDGKNIEGFEKRDFARLVGWLPQSTYNPPHLRARELLSLGRIPHLLNFWDDLLGREEIDALFSRLEIPCKPDDFVESVSGGTSQLLNLGRLIIQAPLFFLFDEPFEGIDQRHQKLALEYLNEKVLQEKSLIIISTHHLIQPLRFAQNIFVVENGLIKRIEKERGHESDIYCQFYF